MQYHRGTVLKAAGSTGLLAAPAALTPAADALAQAAANATLEAKTLADTTKTMGIANPVERKDIRIKAPDIAENGAVVPIEVTSNVPGTESISVFVEKSPFPLAGGFDVSKGAMPFAALRARTGETSNVRIVAAAGGKCFTTSEEVKVTIGGCGG